MDFSEVASLSVGCGEDGLEPFQYGRCGIHHEFLSDGGRLEIVFLPSVGAVADGSAPHGFRKSPSAPAASLFRQYPPLVKSEGAGSWPFRVDGELRGGKEDGVLSPFPVLFIFCMVCMGMFPQPFRYFLFLSYDFTYLEVTIDDVYVFGATQVAEFSVVVCSLLEPPVEQKNVSNSDIVVKELCLGRAFLSEGRHPSGSSWPDFSPEVRIQVATAVGSDEGVLVQLPDDVAERGSVPMDFRERDVVLRRDGQREHGAVGEDGAGLSSVGAVETFSAENDFHR